MFSVIVTSIYDIYLHIFDVTHCEDIFSSFSSNTSSLNGFYQMYKSIYRISQLIRDNHDFLLPCRHSEMQNN